MKIIEYKEIYRDDMIYMVLDAKNALGKVPRINSDLLDIKSSYIDRGDMFWLALDKNDRVIGCVGYSRVEGTTEAFLHRLYVKSSLKRIGIGTELLKTAEDYMMRHGITAVRVHLGEPYEQWIESYNFYPKHGYAEYEPRYMRKSLREEQLL